jgi:hypothetical protein
MERKYIHRDDRPIRIEDDKLREDDVVESWTMIQRIVFAIHTGYGASTIYDGIALVNIYENASSLEREVLDDFVKRLCGFDMSALQDDAYMEYLYEHYRDAAKDE